MVPSDWKAHKQHSSMFAQTEEKLPRMSHKPQNGGR
jgi:hypothetical protein